MPRGSLLRSSTYRFATACSLALVGFVVARAPVWTPAMAGARAQLGSRSIALVSAAWTCSERPHACSTTVAGKELVVQVGGPGDHPITCTATFHDEVVPCTTRLWYAPRLKPFLELGQLRGVSFGAAMRERPWRVLDLGLLGEHGPLHQWAGFLSAFMFALGASSLVRRGGIWWLARASLALLSFIALNAMWFMQCVFLGYID